MSKKVLVTGSSRGIGLEIGKYFAQENWQVCFTSRDRNDLENLKKSFKHDSNLFEVADFTKPDNIKNLFDKIKMKWDSLDAIIINVGSGSGQKSISSTFSNNLKIFELNFYTAYLSSIILSPLMYKSSNSSLIFIGSIAANTNVESPLNYAMAKKSLENLSKYSSLLFKEFKINVNCVHLGHVLTEHGFWENKKKTDEDFYNKILKTKTLTGKLLNPMEVAKFVYNLSQESINQTISGSTLILDSGTSAIK